MIAQAATSGRLAQGVDEVAAGLEKLPLKNCMSGAISSKRS
jgi:hypothetical protein